MTATLERPGIARQPDLAPTSTSGSTTTVATYLRWVLAAVSLGAAGIHFAMIGVHWSEYWLDGAFFAAIAWFQVAWAVGVVMRPSRMLLIAGALVNAGIIGVWAISRTWGVPFGPHSGVAETASFVDILATAFEGALLLGCLALILRPRLNTMRASRKAAIPAWIAGLGVVALTTMAFTPSFADGHMAGGGGHHGGDAAGGEAAAGHHGAPAAGGDVAGHTNAVVQADGTSACEQAGVANEGNSGHGHRGPVPYTELTPDERATFATQVAAANNVVATYPTAAAAEAAGWRRITPYVPCIAAHYLKAGAFRNGFDPNEPEILLFDGTEPTSGIVGLSYLSFADAETPPEGFAGENDPWHVHSQLCIGGGGVLGDESTTEAQCEERGGSLRQLDNLWMMHMWNVPGWDSRWGLFSSEHPDLGGRIGDINGEPQAEEELNESANNSKE
jgi:hypothetical protein